MTPFALRVTVAKPPQNSPSQSIYVLLPGENLQVGRGSICQARTIDRYASRLALIFHRNTNGDAAVLARQKSPGYVEIQMNSDRRKERSRLFAGSRPVVIDPDSEYIFRLHVPDLIVELSYPAYDHTDQQPTNLLPDSQRRASDAETLTRWHPRIMGSMDGDDWVDVIAIAMMLQKFPEMMYQGESFRVALKRICATVRGGTASNDYVNRRLAQALEAITSTRRAVNFPAANEARLPVLIHMFRDIDYFSDGQLSQLRELVESLEAGFRPISDKGH